MNYILIEVSDENYKRIMEIINKFGIVDVKKTFSVFINKALDKYLDQYFEKRTE